MAPAPPEPSHAPAIRRARVVSAVAVLALALGLRLATAAEVLGPPQQAAATAAAAPALSIRVAGADGYLHLRRMALAARGPGLLPPRMDRWMHVPQGVSRPWPPLFDATGGLMARAAGGGPEDLDTTAWAGFTLVGTLALLAVLLAVVVGTRLGGWAGGLIAGLAVAASPAHLNASVLGRLDHHVLEALVPALIFETVRWRGEAGPPRSFALRAGSIALLTAFTAGALPSAAVPLGLGVGAVALWLVAPGASAAHSPARGRDAAATVVGLLLGALALVPFSLGYGGQEAAAGPAGVAGGGSAFSMGPFQPSLLAALGLALAAVEAVASRPAQAGWARRWRPALALAGGALAGGAALILLPGGRDALAAGGGFVSRATSFTALISESRPLLDRGLGFAAVFATPLSFAAPVLAGFLAYRARHGGRGGRARGPGVPADGAGRATERSLTAWVYGALSLVTLALALAQARFAVLAVLPLAITAGAAAGALTRAARHPRRTAWALVALTAAALAPGAVLAARARIISPRRLAVHDALRWLRAHGAPTGDAWRPETAPTYSVLAPWSFGHDVLTVGARANVASPYLLPGYTQGLQAALRFELATDPTEAQALLAAHRTRYVLSAPPSLDGLRRYALALGRDPDAYVRLEPQGPPRLTPLGRRTIHRRLADTGGAALPAGQGPHEPAAPGLGFLALRYVTPGGGAKLYEVVPGAKVRAQDLPPGAHVAIQVDLAGVFGRWRWETQGRADDRGEATMRVPYCTRGTGGTGGTGGAGGGGDRSDTDAPHGAGTAGGRARNQRPVDVRVLGAWLKGPAGAAPRPLAIPCEAVGGGAVLRVRGGAGAAGGPAR